MTKEEINKRGCKTIEEEPENGDIVILRYPDEIKDWNNKCWEKLNLNS